MIAYKLYCSECNKEEVYIDKNTYSGRSPLSVAKRTKKRHIRNSNHANNNTVNIKEGGWDKWSEEFIDED